MSLNTQEAIMANVKPHIVETDKLPDTDHTNPVEAAANPASVPQATSPPDPFDPANLRLDQSFTETVAVKKLLTTIPVRRPGRQTFFRVHPDPEYRDQFPIIDLKDDREEYIVARPLVPELASEIVLKQLCLAVTRQGVAFFLPLRLPSPDGKDMEWWRSLREHAVLAQTRWIRVVANQGLGAYEAWVAADNLSEPEWPELKFWDLIKIAFKDYLITDLNHQVVKRLRGLA
jgi:hypothetical protein